MCLSGAFCSFRRFRRSLHRSASALRQKLHYAISLFLFHAKALRWALHGVRKVLFVLFVLMGYDTSATQKTKITRKSITVRCTAVLPEQKSVQAMKSPQAILCVLARALKRHGRISARQNRVCPCQPRVLSCYIIRTILLRIKRAALHKPYAFDILY